MINVDISILEIGGSGALLRDIAETLQIQNPSGKIGQPSVTASLHFIGQPLHLMDWLRNAQHLGRYIVLACHGGDLGICFDEYAPEIDVSMLKDRQFPYELLFELGDFAGKTVFNMGCTSAGASARAAFRSQPNFHYVGYDGYPDGDADILIFHKLFYELFHGATLDEAIAATKSVCSDAAFLRKLGS